MNLNAVELIGYLGSILVAISLMMKSLLRLRIINLFGALFFTVYGVLLGAYPVAFLNGIIVCIDLYYLFQMWRQKDFFTLLEVSPQGKYLNAFVNFHRDDILEIIPSYRYTADNDLLCFFILRNMMPAGLFIARVRGEVAQVQLDYVIPNYRDLKVARFIFEENADFFRERGIRRFVSDGGSAIHRKYLEKMEFVKNGETYVHEIGTGLLHDNRL
jgi:GNAT superfamily N-acetyltransferase